MEKTLKLSPPWIKFYREIAAMFKNDKDVKVVYNDTDTAVNLYVEDPDKADALMQILVSEKDFGNVKLMVNVIPADKMSEDTSNLPLFQRAFKGNSALNYTTEEQLGLFSMAYAVFKPEIVQFFNDDLSDAHGIASMLYQDIAYDIFKNDLNVYFCTDLINEKVGMPLGEWP